MPRRLTRGSFGSVACVFPVAQVKFAVNTETGEKVAIKILDKEKIQKQNMGGASHSCVGKLAQERSRRIARWISQPCRRPRRCCASSISCSSNQEGGECASGHFERCDAASLLARPGVGCGGAVVQCGALPPASDAATPSFINILRPLVAEAINPRGC